MFGSCNSSLDTYGFTKELANAGKQAGINTDREGQ